MSAQVLAAWETGTNQTMCTNIWVGKHQTNQTLQHFGTIC